MTTPALLTEWFSAIKAGEVETVKQLLEKCAGSFWSDGQTGLMRAVLSNHEEIAMLLLPYEKHRFCYRGYTALMWAVYANSIHFTKLLVDEEGGDQNEWGATALMYAVLFNREEIIPLLIEKEARKGLTKNFFGELPSYEDGIIPHCIGKTALMLAAEAGLLSAVKLLLDSEKDCISSQNKTAADYALEAGRKDIYTFLIEEGEMEEPADANDPAKLRTEYDHDANRGFGNLSLFCTPRSEEIVYRHPTTWSLDDIAYMFSKAVKVQNKLFTNRLLLLLSLDAEVVKRANNFAMENKTANARQYRLLLFGLTTCGTVSTLQRFLLDLAEPYFSTYLLSDKTDPEYFRDAEHLVDLLETYLVEFLAAPGFTPELASSLFDCFFDDLNTLGCLEHLETYQLCVVCMDRLSDCVLMPCRHVSFCKQCVPELTTKRECPICRSEIKSYFQVNAPYDFYAADTTRQKLEELDAQYARQLAQEEYEVVENL